MIASAFVHALKSVTDEGKVDLIKVHCTTQGDPLAMSMHPLPIRPLIDTLREAKPKCKVSMFVDDTTAAERLATLGQWWWVVTTTVTGPEFGYNPNVRKTHLVVMYRPACLGSWRPEHCQSGRNSGSVCQDLGAPIRLQESY